MKSRDSLFYNNKHCFDIKMHSLKINLKLVAAYFFMHPITTGSLFL